MKEYNPKKRLVVYKIAIAAQILLLICGTISSKSDEGQRVKKQELPKQTEEEQKELDNTSAEQAEVLYEGICPEMKITYIDSKTKEQRTDSGVFIHFKIWLKTKNAFCYSVQKKDDKCFEVVINKKTPNSIKMTAGEKVPFEVTDNEFELTFINPYSVVTCTKSVPPNSDANPSGGDCVDEHGNYIECLD